MAWIFEEWFSIPVTEAPHPVVRQAENYLLDKHIERHEFFEYAAHSPQALREWVTQEIIVTGPFSQLLLQVSAIIKNVHVRSMVVEVASEEHGGTISKTIAEESHPWLLREMMDSMNIPSESIQPYPETDEFLDILRQECYDPLRGIAALGVGNERLLIPEYGAVKNAFAQGWPTCKYQAFLDANIEADKRHSELMSEAAVALIAQGAEPSSYLDAAIHAIDARYEFYNKLLSRVKQL